MNEPSGAKKSKGRKIGRASRSSSHSRYNASKRWIENKAKRILKRLKKHPHQTHTISSDVESAMNRIR